MICLRTVRVPNGAGDPDCPTAYHSSYYHPYPWYDRLKSSRILLRPWYGPPNSIRIVSIRIPNLVESRNL